MNWESNHSPRVIVVGGGLAGMAATIALQSAGARVTLIESRRSLGGRAGSYQHPQTGEILDNCQHVLLGCCTNLLDFYRRLGVVHKIRWADAIRFLDENGRQHVLRGLAGIPSPLHLALGGAGFTALSIRHRIALSRAMFAMLRLGRQGLAALDHLPFGDWLRQHHQPAELIQRFYDVVLVSALNEASAQVSAKYAIQVFYDGMLAHRDGYRMGVPDCPLDELYPSSPFQDLRPATRAVELRIDSDRVIGVVLSDGALIDADAVVLATNYHAMEKLVGSEWMKRDARLGGLAKLESVPILGAHFRFDRPILRYPHVALMRGPLQWIFKKSGDGRAMHGVISAAREWTDQPREIVLDALTAQIRSLFPAAGDARLEHSAIVVEKRATFSPRPGTDALRPAQAPPVGGLRGLYLAGDYTRTDWPATMEGAVRSGYLAADAIVAEYQPDAQQATDHTPRPFLMDDLPVEWPAKLLEAGSVSPGRA